MPLLSLFLFVLIPFSLPFFPSLSLTFGLVYFFEQSSWTFKSKNRTVPISSCDFTDSLSVDTISCFTALEKYYKTTASLLVPGMD